LKQEPIRDLKRKSKFNDPDMFKKVLVADDYDSINIAARQLLEAMRIDVIEHAKYCDEAMIKIKKANKDQQPFDLLICDLSFKKDHRPENIANGEELIEKIKFESPGIKIIVYSIEDKPYRVKSLFEKLGVEAYVYKGRHSIDQLKAAILNLAEAGTYISPELSHVFRDKTVNEIDDYDLQLMKQLSLGVSQEKMAEKFLELGIFPNGKSTIEKRINKLKTYFQANNPTHLVALAKDAGVI
jgi:two-component system capsular synthesis response regulator RcsB